MCRHNLSNNVSVTDICCELMQNTSIVFRAAKKPATLFGFEHTVEALMAADIQNSRIFQHESFTGDFLKDSVIAMKIITDIQFYIMSVRNIKRYGRLIVLDDTFSSLRDTLLEIESKWIDKFKSMRDSLEHMDERFPGCKKSQAIVEVCEGQAKRKIHRGFSLSEGVFRHSDQQLDISHGTFLNIATDVLLFLSDVAAIAKETARNKSTI